MVRYGGGIRQNRLLIGFSDDRRFFVLVLLFVFFVLVIIVVIRVSRRGRSADEVQLSNWAKRPRRCTSGPSEKQRPSSHPTVYWQAASLIRSPTCSGTQRGAKSESSHISIVTAVLATASLASSAYIFV